MSNRILASALSTMSKPGRAAATHWLFTLMIVMAIALRVAYMSVFERIFMIQPDSFGYLRAAATGIPDPLRPFGYSVLLDLVRLVTDSVTAVSAVQHVLGLALAVLIYACLYRRGVRPWLAALPAAPVLFDAWQVSLEHYVMAETLFTILTVGAVLVLIRPGRLGIGAAIGAGLLLVTAGLTRTVGLPVVLLAVGYLLIRRAGWRVCATFLAAFTVPLLGYAVWFHSHYGVYGTAENPALPLYGRTAQVADCSRLPALTERERRLCPAEPLDERHAPDWYWLNGSVRPALQFANDDPVFDSFNGKVLRAQFPAVVKQWAKDTSFFFRVAEPDDRASCLNQMWVPVAAQPTPLWWCYPHPALTDSFDAAIDGNAIRAEISEERLPTHLYAYLAEARTPPFLLTAAIVITLVGSLRRATPRSNHRSPRATLRPPAVRGDDGWAALFSTAVALALLALGVAGSMFDIRYALPALPLLGLSAALTVNQLLGGRRAGQPATGATMPSTGGADAVAPTAKEAPRTVADQLGR